MSDWHEIPTTLDRSKGWSDSVTFPNAPDWTATVIDTTQPVYVLCTALDEPIKAFFRHKDAAEWAEKKIRSLMAATKVADMTFKIEELPELPGVTKLAVSWREYQTYLRIDPKWPEHLKAVSQLGPATIRDVFFIRKIDLS